MSRICLTNGVPGHRVAADALVRGVPEEEDDEEDEEERGEDEGENEEDEDEEEGYSE